MRALNSSLSPAGVQGGGSLALRDRRVAAAISDRNVRLCAGRSANGGWCEHSAHACWSAAHWLSSEVPEQAWLWPDVTSPSDDMCVVLTARAPKPQQLFDYPAAA